MRRALCLVLLVGCSPFSSGELAIDRVDPAFGPNTASVPVKIEGNGFHLAITSSLDHNTTVVGTMTVAIGNAPLDNMVWQGEQLIEGAVPAGLAEGSYDVSVTIGDHAGVLANGYTVTNSEPGVDAAQGSADGGTDAPAACVAGFLDLCAQAPPTMPLDVTTAATINTDTDPRCHTLMQASGLAVCLVFATSVNVAAGASLTATGTRPLAIASTSTLTIAGTIDVSSERVSGRTGPAADDASCTFAAVPEPDLGGAGGAAGGSFGAIGGAGGTGDTDNSIGGDGTALPGLAGPIATVSRLRGGCAGQLGANESAGGGQGGVGGQSGGALYLYAAQRVDIVATGRVRATGAGATGGQVQAGGGGGGTGGAVVIESLAISIAGQISANGGAGGEGGGRIGTTPVTGNPGADGDFGTAAAGGSGIDSRLGYGGTGGGATGATSGLPSIIGGGGGGGGGGIVKLLGASMVTGVVSPSPI